MATVTTSKSGSLNLRDLVKGLIVVVGTAVISNVYEIIQNSISSGTFTMPTKQELLRAAYYGIAAGLAYLIKNFFTPAQIVITGAHPDTVEEVKNGEADVTVTPK